MAEEKAAPMFQEHLLTKIHTLVELPISHGLIERMQTLESLLPHFEVREFQYSDLRGTGNLDRERDLDCLRLIQRIQKAG
jgi:hypothetical protein